ncbi:hypothetical protein ACOZ4L_16550 (plasmid) [Haloplanus ruber]|uniref:Uncharacterized protein n=1 Tax=Haloplanus ruber TaxID=869892 RepID=A0ABD6D280_9EURY|nr:hypothetical protein [Haloplanus ruber]
MSDETKPDPPDLPAYVVEPLEKQSPEDLKLIATYADVLADWKRAQREDNIAAKRAAEEVDEETIEEIEQRGFETDPEAYEDVPSKAYITIKETKPGYHYYYWQWREGDSWANEYIGPVSPKD